MSDEEMLEALKRGVAEVEEAIAQRHAANGELTRASNSIAPKGEGVG
jgi:hypothetical protein